MVGASLEDSKQTTITNGTSASANNSNTDSGAVYVYRNNARLFDPGDISYSQNAGDVTFRWTSGGLLATGYLISYQTGTTAPASCSLGDDEGNVTTATIVGLTSNQT